MLKLGVLSIFNNSLSSKNPEWCYCNYKSWLYRSIYL